jgi:hypothetical protein
MSKSNPVVVGGMRSLGIALALALGGLPSSMLTVGRKVRSLDWNAGKKSPKAPFSSTRQHERYRRQGLHTKVVNGFPIMQTRNRYER